MTVTVEKRMDTLGSLRGVHPDLMDAPTSILRGMGDHEGDLDMAGKAAKQVYENWDDDAWRNAFIMALADHINRMLWVHRGELHVLREKARARAYADTRRSIVKSYINDTLNEVVSKAPHERRIHVDPYRRNDGTEVAGYDRKQMAALASAMLRTSLHPYTPDPETQKKPQEFEYAVMHEGGEITHHRHEIGSLPNLEPGDRIVQAVQTAGPKPGMGQDNYNLAMMLGAGNRGARRAGILTNEMQRQGQIGYGPDSWFARLKSATETFHHATNGAKVPTAVSMGMYVGKHGPEVSRVLGPHIRRYHYKYRGTTASGAELTQLARGGRVKDSKGKPQEIPGYERQLLLNLAAPRSEGGLDAIPTEAESQVMLKTGNTAPSHGYIIDRDGKVAQQAQGFSDDHYVPFNLRDLHALNYGHYVRSRTYGGPTTEDISLAMKTGTKSFETISRHGIYRVEFTPRTDKTGRKIGAWAKDVSGNASHIMVNRYGRLLDAIKNGKIKDPATDEPVKLNGQGYAVALRSLQKQFPYYIKNVEYIPAPHTGNQLEGERAAYSDEDTGYIRPYYLKPGAARHGYYDTWLGGDEQDHTFDDVDAYRMSKARWLMQQADARKKATARQVQEEAQSKQDEIDRRLGHSPVPTRRSPSASPIPNKYPWAAGTGEYGAAQQSTPATNPGHLTDAQTHNFINEVAEALNHIGPSHDDDNESIAQLHTAVNNPNVAESNFFQDVKEHPDARQDILDNLNYLAQHMADDHTGLEMIKTINVRYKPKGVQLEEDTGDAGRQDDVLIADIKASPDYRRYQAWSELYRTPLPQWERTGRDQLGPKKQEQFDALMRKKADWEKRQPVKMADGKTVEAPSLREQMEMPLPHYEGLAEYQVMENRLAEAYGADHPHPIPVDYNPEPKGPTNKATTDDELRDRSDEFSVERQKQAEKEVDDFLRDVDPRDQN